MSRGYDDDYDDHSEGGREPYEPGEDVPPAPASKTSVPGALMLATGVLNLLLGVGGFFVGFVFQNMPPEEFEKAYQQQPEERRKQMEAEGWTPKDLINIYVRGGYGVAAAGGIGGLLSIIGGICLMTRKARGLAIFTALTTALPLTSPCCLFGLPVGIWALVVLFQEDVRVAFR